ncbi:MAG: DUF2061 domain-containing protein [Thermoplasmata archaeon]|nr:MAG: DUF2061 domain-containing protein [Thermoplasmata archaeon]
MSDTWLRSIAKGATWFTIRFVTLFIITYFIIGDTITAGTLTTIYYSVGVFIFLIHERVWNKIKFGRIANNSKE